MFQSDKEIQLILHILPKKKDCKVVPRLAQVKFQTSYSYYYVWKYISDMYWQDVWSGTKVTFFLSFFLKGKQGVTETLSSTSVKDCTGERFDSNNPTGLLKTYKRNKLTKKKKRLWHLCRVLITRSTYVFKAKFVAARKLKSPVGKHRQGVPISRRDFKKLTSVTNLVWWRLWHLRGIPITCSITCSKLNLLRLVSLKVPSGNRQGFSNFFFFFSFPSQSAVRSGSSSTRCLSSAAPATTGCTSRRREGSPAGSAGSDSPQGK